MDGNRRPGATPEKPWGKAPYVVRGESFSSLEKLKKRVQEIRHSYPDNVEYYDPFLAEIVDTMHPSVVRNGYRITRFRNTPKHLLPPSLQEQLLPSYPWLMMGLFEPIHQWQDVTLYPWLSKGVSQHIKEALRKIWEMRLRPAPTWDDSCARCGRVDQLQYDHIVPSFNEIADACLKVVTQEERDTLFGYDKFEAGTMSLADFILRDAARPVLLLLQESHRNNVWQWLCRDCHILKTSETQRRPKQQHTTQ